MKTESLVDSRVWGYEVEKGMNSYLDFKEPKGLHLQVWGLVSVSDHGVVESRYCSWG